MPNEDSRTLRRWNSVAWPWRIRARQLADGTYIEIDGYLTDQAGAKFEYFLRPLTIFTRAELSRMFDHVHSRYGKDRLSLYE